MNYTEPLLRKLETAQEEQQHQHQHQSGVSYRAAIAANKIAINWTICHLLFYHGIEQL